jgi:hypothetical protein
MQLSRHACERRQQRAIPEMMIDLLLQFGSSESAGSGASKMFFDKTSRRRVKAYAGPLASLLEDHLDVYAIVSTDMTVITVGHRTERIQRQ